MGFRGTFITEDLSTEWPEWFVNKYKKVLNFRSNHHDKKARKQGAISSKYELKHYNQPFTDIIKDIQKVLEEKQISTLDSLNNISLIMFFECGGVAKYTLTKDSITIAEPIEWQEVEEISHSYCYGCSNPKETL